jgi:hypothetical protein
VRGKELVELTDWELGRTAARPRIGKSWREFNSLYTGENSTEVHGMLIHLLGIIRMEREGVEKLGIGG